MISAFDLFKIGIGPSSSHTVGPMKAAKAFVDALVSSVALDVIDRIRVDLYGSLAWTGDGHGTSKAIVLGLCGKEPAGVDLDVADTIVARAASDRSISLAGVREFAFDPACDIVADFVVHPPVHPNTLAFAAYDAAGTCLLTQRWCSIGGGFVVREEDVAASVSEGDPAPFEFRTAAELLKLASATGLSIAEIVRANEYAHSRETLVSEKLRLIVAVMMASIDRGLRTEGLLPGGLNVARRAPALHAQLASNGANKRQPAEIMDFISVYAIAVNEENASGGRIVTAPTNGAAGVVPAVLRYYLDFCDGADTQGVETFLLTAAAIGALFKMNASISGAEVGCQGEVGVACSMAAAGLAAALGGTAAQVENAAEIGMEHHLGMTCDPVGGLVQIPCIERNAFGAIKAVNAASLALLGNGEHRVSLDQVIAAMRETGADMNQKYKETSRGGLAVNWVEC